jgi:hypothetical protein
MSITLIGRTWNIAHRRLDSYFPRARWLVPTATGGVYREQLFRHAGGAVRQQFRLEIIAICSVYETVFCSVYMGNLNLFVLKTDPIHSLECIRKHIWSCKTTPLKVLVKYVWLWKTWEIYSSHLSLSYDTPQ